MRLILTQTKFALLPRAIRHGHVIDERAASRRAPSTLVALLVSVKLVQNEQPAVGD
jgi:hypothetical protein